MNRKIIYGLVGLCVSLGVNESVYEDNIAKDRDHLQIEDKTARPYYWDRLKVGSDGKIYPVAYA